MSREVVPFDGIVSMASATFDSWCDGDRTEQRSRAEGGHIYLSSSRAFAGCAAAGVCRKHAMLGKLKPCKTHYIQITRGIVPEDDTLHAHGDSVA